MAEERADYDSPWKLALARFWRPFLELCFPPVAAGIEWQRPVEFLDKELQGVVHDAQSGRRHVDTLAKVFRTDGTELWVLVHVEIQNRPDPGFATRMYRYHQRLSDRYDRPVASLAVLTDARPNWRPDHYEAELWGCRLRFEFPICKLLDLDGATLERPANPVAFVVAAHRAAQRFRRDPEALARAKSLLMLRLKDHGYTNQDVLDLIWLIDWLIQLPNLLEVKVRNELRQWETENAMPFITSFERLARQEGRQEGREEGRQEERIESAREAIRDVLLARFGNVPVDLNETIQSASDRAQLRQWLRLAVTEASLVDLRAALNGRVEATVGCPRTVVSTAEVRPQQATLQQAWEQGTAEGRGRTTVGETAR